MSDESSSEEIIKNKNGKIRIPKKKDYRQHAHCNPLSNVTMQYPFSPECIDWSLNYPLIFNPQNTKNNSKLYLNTSTNPINYNNEKYTPISTSNLPKNFLDNPHVNIIDIGCGYGGLLYNMSEYLDEGDLAIGMEIRDKVTNYVGEKIKALRLNSDNKLYNNISVVRSNTMKLLLNYFYKGQVDKMFFCFADPHFKKYNHRKRIINKYLLNDYSYLIKIGGRLYIITDVEELFEWEVFMIKQNPCFKEISKEECEKDKFVDFMKNTNEAKKVAKANGKMFYKIYERVEPKINSIEELYNIVDFTKED